jgi:hypothetical protein
VLKNGRTKELKGAFVKRGALFNRCFNRKLIKLRERLSERIAADDVQVLESSADLSRGPLTRMCPGCFRDVSVASSWSDQPPGDWQSIASILIGDWPVKDPGAEGPKNPRLRGKGRETAEAQGQDSHEVESKRPKERYRERHAQWVRQGPGVRVRVRVRVGVGGGRWRGSAMGRSRARV